VRLVLLFIVFNLCLPVVVFGPAFLIAVLSSIEWLRALVLLLDEHQVAPQTMFFHF